VWEVAVIAFLNGTAMSLNQPSYQALVPRLVKREDLTNAIALNSAQYNMSRILGPTLGGYAMALMGVAGNFFLNGLSFLAVLFALTRIRYPVEKEPREESMLASLRAGFRYVRGRPQMFVLVGMIAVSSLLTMPFLVFIPYFARVQLGASRDGRHHRGLAGQRPPPRLGDLALRSGRHGGGGRLLLHPHLRALGLPHAAGGLWHDPDHLLGQRGHAAFVLR
jgi:hypothetical protein